MAWDSKNVTISRNFDYINHRIINQCQQKILDQKIFWCQFHQPAQFSWFLDLPLGPHPSLAESLGPPASARPSRPAAARPRTGLGGWSSRPGWSPSMEDGDTKASSYTSDTSDTTYSSYHTIIYHWRIVSCNFLPSIGLWSNCWWVLGSVYFGVKMDPKSHRHWNLQARTCWPNKCSCLVRQISKVQYPTVKNPQKRWTFHFWPPGHCSNDGVFRIPCPPLVPYFMIIMIVKTITFWSSKMPRVDPHPALKGSEPAQWWRCMGVREPGSNRRGILETVGIQQIPVRSRDNIEEKGKPCVLFGKLT